MRARILKGWLQRLWFARVIRPKGIPKRSKKYGAFYGSTSAKNNDGRWSITDRGSFRATEFQDLITLDTRHAPGSGVSVWDSGCVMCRAETKVIKVRRIPRCLAFTALVVVSIWLTTGAFAAEQKAPDSPKPATTAPSPPPADIPLADIAARATEVSNLISSLTTAAVPAAQIENIAKSLSD